MKKIINSKCFYFTIIFLFVLVFNILTPYIMDDYQYMFIHDNNGRVKSLIDVFKELYNMYFTWGGRVFAHFFAYIFLMLPKWVFNIVNSIVYVLNIYLIYLIGKGNKKDNYKYLLLIHMIIFIFFPAFGQVFLWLDGSCNYSFTLCVQLFFIYKILNIKEKNNIFIYIIISLLAGMCNENSSLSLIVFLILYMIYDRSNLKLKITSLISLIIGYLFMFLAPGNYVRLNHQGSTSLFHNIIPKFSYLIISFWPIILAFLILVIVYAIRDKEKGKLSIMYYISALIAFFSMMASPRLSIRSFTMPVIYMFIVTTMFIFNCLLDKKNILRFITFIMVIVFTVITFNTYKEYIRYNKFINNRINTINKAVKEKKTSVKLKIYSQSSNCRIPIGCCLDDIVKDYKKFPNYFMSKYYGIKIYGYK